MLLKTKTQNKSPKNISFFEHFDELRSRLIKSIVAIVIAACLFYSVIDQALAILIKPAGSLVFISPGEAFVARMTLTLFGGLFLALPVICYQIWKFIASGLKTNEIRFVRFFAPCSLVLFLLGALFAFYITIPISLRFLLSFSSALITPMISVKSYISFVGTMLLAFGIIFELPLVIMFLTKLGIATPAFLEQKRNFAIVIILIVSALITPPDFITQLIMAVPLIVLYEIGIIVSKLTYRE